MIEEQAIVTDTEGQLAQLVSQRQSACGSCSANKACGTHAMSKMFSGREVKVTALNTLGAKPGDKVIVGLDEFAFMRGSVAIYLVPLLIILGFLALGYFAGQGSNNADAFGVIGTVIGLVSSAVWLKAHAKLSKHNKKYQPVVLRFADKDIIAISK